MMQKFTSSLLAMSLLFLAACSSNDISEEDLTEPAELEKINEEVELRKNWSVSVGDGQGKSYIRIQPFYHAGAIYVAEHGGEVLKLDADSGKTLWEAETEKPISGGIAVDAGMVLFGTADGEVVALDAETGGELWTAAVRSEVLSAPRGNGRVVVAHSYDGRVHGLNAENGKMLWEYESQMPKLTLRGSASPVLVRDVAIVGLANGKLVALSIDSGSVRWEHRVTIAQGRSEIDRIVDIDGTPLLDGQALYAVSYRGRLVALNLQNGRPAWQKDASSYVSVAEGFSNVYVAEANGNVVAYSAGDGALQWQNEDLSWRKLSAPATLGNYVVVADFEGYLHLLSQVDGHIAGRERPQSDGARAGLLRYRDSILVYGDGGKLVSLSISE